MILALSALRANKQLNVCYSGISTSLSRLWSSTTRHLSAIATLLPGRFDRTFAHHWRPLKWSTWIWHFNRRNEAFVHFNRNQCKPRQSHHDPLSNPKTQVSAIGVGRINEQEIRGLTDDQEGHIFYLMSWESVQKFNRIFEKVSNRFDQQACLPLSGLRYEWRRA